MDQDDRLYHYVESQFGVFRAALGALFATHPDPEALRKAFHTLCELDLASSLSDQVPDEALELAEAQRKLLRDAIPSTPDQSG